MYPPINALSKNMKYINFFPINFSIFTVEKKSMYIAWACFRNEASKFTLEILPASLKPSFCDYSSFVSNNGEIVSIFAPQAVCHVLGV